ncbi:MAG: hypothetical protein AAGJ82_00520 [Bacteroidota bacterium]
MAKKRFTEGLDSLFADESGEQGLSLFPDEQASRDDAQKPSKGLNAKLDAFLSDALENAKAEAEAPSKKKKAKSPRRLTGLDLLIRPTGEAPPRRKKTKIADTRRLTLAFNKAQLAELKTIAEAEGLLLRDLINELIDRYLQERK